MNGSHQSWECGCINNGVHESWEYVALIMVCTYHGSMCAPTMGELVDQ